MPKKLKMMLFMPLWGDQRLFVNLDDLLRAYAILFWGPLREVYLVVLYPNRLN